MIELTRDQKLNLSDALEKLSQAVSAQTVNELKHKCNGAVTSIQRIITQTDPNKYELNELEAGLSQGLHTYMRKCMDGIYSVVLWRMLDEKRGREVWFAFIKALIKSKYNYKKSIASLSDDDFHSNTDTYVMQYVLAQWGEEEFGYAINWVKECNYLTQ